MATEVNLYEYDEHHVGSKSYVSVDGHTRLVPKYKTYSGKGGKRYLRPEFGGTWDGSLGASATIMPDKLEYLSPLDGKTFVTSRSTHREHMNRHGVVEAGDMKIGSSTNIERSPMGRVAPDVIRAMQELGSR
jgi:hypothetical protein